ncbi:MFS transporter [Streptantibioticus silvisoli]|uniref:MFS transporter n=1 Tax=Streptantibioticus silvisoli TaxID=2705255 RepID=A0ABT6W9Y4_9ACTN|nr:MFS transporter [Streptantibioticus silvisoli]MDI5966351.1 MFS transporter [Streptantibioticus silvisoli]
MSADPGAAAPGAPAAGMRWFRFLVAGNAVSSYGSYLNMVALNLFALQVTGSALQTGLIMAARLAVGFCTGFVSGGVVSRHSRKIVMMAGDSSQALALVALLCAPGGSRTVALYTVAVVAGAGGTLSQVALRSAVPEMVGAALRVRANALLATGRAFAMVLGFASAGVVVSALGYRAAFVLDAVTFAVSVATMAWLPIRTRRAGPPPPGAPGAGLAALRKGLGVLRPTPVLLAMIAIRAVDGFGSASHNVGLPVYSTALDAGHPAAFVSRFWATWAIGNIVVQRLVVRWAARTGRGIGEAAFALGTCAMSAGFILVFTGPPLVLGVAFALLAGMADGFTENAYLSRLQTVPDDDRGYVFGCSSMAENLGFGSGTVLTALLLEHHTPLSVVAVSHGTAIGCGAVFLAALALRRLRAGPGTPEPAVPEPAAPMKEVSS